MHNFGRVSTHHTAVGSTQRNNEISYRDLIKLFTAAFSACLQPRAYQVENVESVIEHTSVPYQCA